MRGATKVTLAAVILYHPATAAEAAKFCTWNPAGAVYFSRGSSSLTPEAQYSLVMQANWLKYFDRCLVLIEGHTDRHGAASHNLRLSIERALTAKQALMDNGIPSDRIKIVGLGSGKPIAICPTPSEQCDSQNRSAHTRVRNPECAACVPPPPRPDGIEF